MVSIVRGSTHSSAVGGEPCKNTTGKAVPKRLNNVSCF
jgi:hypothetical protein